MYYVLYQLTYSQMDIQYRNKTWNPKYKFSVNKGKWVLYPSLLRETPENDRGEGIGRDISEGTTDSHSQSCVVQSAQRGTDTPLLSL